MATPAPHVFCKSRFHSRLFGDLSFDDPVGKDQRHIAVLARGVRHCRIVYEMMSDEVLQCRVDDAERRSLRASHLLRHAHLLTDPSCQVNAVDSLLLASPDIRLDRRIAASGEIDDAIDVLSAGGWGVMTALPVVRG